MREEILRHQLLHNRKLTPERIEEIIPPYPTTGPTILSADDLPNIRRQSPRDESESQKSEFDRLKKEQSRSDSTLRPIRELYQDLSLLDIFKLKISHEASNNWVISGKKTNSGKPMMADDPHLDLTSPSLWILFHLEGPETHLIGSTMAGFPGIIIGRNAEIAWSVTNVGTDIQDLYIVDKGNTSDSYMVNGTRHVFSKRTETIVVKNDQPDILVVKETVMGPVVSQALNITGENDEDVALRWVALDEDDTTAIAMYKVMYARNFDEFRSALSLLTNPAQNFIYADIQGNIGYQCPGRTPIRVEGHSGKYPVHSNSSYHWQGFVSFSELPFVLNPKSGFIVSANNQVLPNGYLPHIAYDFASPQRATRIVDMINLKSKIQVEDMIEIQLDTVTVLYSQLRPLIQRLVLTDDDANQWRNKVLAWNGNVAADSEEATVFEVFYLELSKILQNETGIEYWNRRPTFLISHFVEKNLNLEFASESFLRALNRIRSISKKGIIPWGQLHHLSIQHNIMENSPVGCLWERRASIGGDDFTINVAHFDRENFDVRTGPSYRHIIDLEDMDKSLFIFPMGESGNPYSNYFDNLLPSYLAGKYIPMRMSGYDVYSTLSLVRKKS
eukprot:TRINITY_DN1054_c0_g1_i1.p1 TRINITY_DN1054_c0_g1~~TRINITY_DN1054_c0_g1_i1.p1  ORF type:complete len:615 (-),score=211.65 TRINITY_DN1054_c0_g1_i1:60-1904(-)